MPKFYDSITDNLRDWVSYTLFLLSPIYLLPSVSQNNHFACFVTGRGFVGARAAGLFHRFGTVRGQTHQRLSERLAVVDVHHL